jgi:hypothetical protein
MYNFNNSALIVKKCKKYIAFGIINVCNKSFINKFSFLKSFGNILILFLFLGYLFSCEDDKYISSSDVKLRFSVDAVAFDTVFTTIGSTTQHLKVYNPYNQKVLISSIKLSKGSSSNYHLNINGISSDEVQNMEIAARDSMYIFVEVTVDPSNQSLPLLVKDSIEFVTNSNHQYVNLVAYGQDFNLIKGKISQDAIWTSDKPYLVYTDSYVESSSSLIIDAGAKIYFHKGAGLHIQGSLNANGTVENPIFFYSDRLETSYANVPDQWDGISLYPGSKNNVLSNVEIKNANIGLMVGNIGTEGGSDVKLTNVKIQNMAYAGIYAVQSNLNASNCLITNCGYYAVALLVSGSYEFIHSTIANYWSGSLSTRTTPAVYISNDLTVSKKDYSGNLDDVSFQNCIITGNLSSKTELYLNKNSNYTFNYTFNHCIIQLSQNDVFSSDSHYVGCFKTSPDSIFVDPTEKYNFELDPLSRAKDAGDVSVSKLYPYDLKGYSRLLDDGPDLGALEWRAESDE